MRNSRRITLLAALLCLLAAAVLPAQESAEDLELWSYIQRQSPQWYESYYTQNGLVDAGPWTQPVETAFLKLANSSGEKGFNISYAVVNRDDFNAMCFPGGQFVIHSGTLDLLDLMINLQEGRSTDRIPADELSLLREEQIAPILAHELGHYYNRHSFQSMKTSWTFAEMGSAEADLTRLQYSRENEYEADATGMMLLKQAGYSPELMMATLELINVITQDSLADDRNMQFNSYLTTHPSPNLRLAALEEDPAGRYRWLADLEKAFSDVQLGINLEQAVKTLETGLDKVPGNLYLMKTIAVGRHKQWLATTSMGEQVLRGILDQPTFRDDMVYFPAGSRGKGIPGNARLYRLAKEAYERVMDDAVDPGFLSNLALLMAYSPEPADEERALDLAYRAVEYDQTIANLTNYGTVLFLVGLEENGLELIGEIAGAMAQQVRDTYLLAATDADVMSMVQEGLRHTSRVQALDGGYVPNDYVAVLNFALCLQALGEGEAAREVAALYFSEYESASDWAVHLSRITGIPRPEPPEPGFLPVDGVRIYDPLVTLMDKWGFADEITTADDGEELWNYNRYHARVGIRDGVVSSIELFSPGSPSVDGRLEVGDSRREIESVLGSPKRAAMSYLIYEGPQNMAVAYSDERAEILLLFP